MVSTAPSQRSTVNFVKEKNHTKATDSSITAMSTVVMPVMASGLIVAVSPKINRMLNK